MKSEYSPEYLRALRKLTPSERWETARRLYWHAREIRAEVLRLKYPDWNEEEVQDEVRRLFMYADE